MSSDLTLYVVYCRPRDFPEEWVVRRHFVKGGICWVDRELFARAIRWRPCAGRCRSAFPASGANLGTMARSLNVGFRVSFPCACGGVRFLRARPAPGIRRTSHRRWLSDGSEQLAAFFWHFSSGAHGSTHLPAAPAAT